MRPFLFDAACASAKAAARAIGSAISGVVALPWAPGCHACCCSTSFVSALGIPRIKSPLARNGCSLARGICISLAAWSGPSSPYARPVRRARTHKKTHASGFTASHLEGLATIGGIAWLVIPGELVDLPLLLGAMAILAAQRPLPVRERGRKLRQGGGA